MSSVDCRSAQKNVDGVLEGCNFAYMTKNAIEKYKNISKIDKHNREETMLEKKTIRVDRDAQAVFYNSVDFCIGTGRMGLALTQEYQEQLKLVQEEIGFSHIRGHGLFCDDMAIYQEYEENGVKKVEYNYTYLDRVMDFYRSVGLRPFLELGFMPEKLARGTQTIFYWKGNTTPPRDYNIWCEMVQSLLRHLMQRYGAEEVVKWPIEVWNEPNLSGFWENADMQEYFRLFCETFHAIKAVDARFHVGGPAVCGGTDEVWIRAFLEYCREQKLAVDFVTRHHYTIEQPDCVGHYDYVKLIDPKEGFANLRTSREIVDSFAEYKNLPIHITEFNTSYTPKSVIHDTNLNAAFIAHQLSRLGDGNASYSYWTFGDVFEEQGVPFIPFHGGFGLVAEGCIPKPTFWTFVFYKKLQESDGACVYKDDNLVVLRKQNGDYLGVGWNPVEENIQQDKNIVLSLATNTGEYGLLIKTVDEETCNPLKVWHDLGEPANLTNAQKKLLRQAAQPFVQTNRLESTDADIEISLSLKRNAVVYFEVWKCDEKSDRGYDYKRAIWG